jgi:aspartyl aminopeptidase
MTRSKALETTQDLMGFIEAGPTAAHAIAEAAKRLVAAGFVRLDEGQPWDLQPDGRYFTSRGANALVAARIGTAAPAETGFRLAAAHSDAPGLRLKPTAHYDTHGYLQLGVEVYGGPLLASWVDRDLTVAGKLLVRQSDAPPQVKLVHVVRPLCRIPQVAIHFNREVNKEGLRLDLQKHLPPIYGLGDQETLRSEPLLELLAEEAHLQRADIVATDLALIDTQPPALGGVGKELFFAPRIDNLAGCHAVLQALIAAESSAPATRVIALFDSEEIGSQTLGGAGSCFLDAALERICLLSSAAREAWHRALSRTRLVSVDGAHALHPNYVDLHDPRHRPLLNRGPVIKVNAKQRYATDASSGHWFAYYAEKAGVPLQHYVHRTDLPCGSTIGPMTATRLGVATVDVGNPMLSMHSIRETGGSEDQHYMICALGEHFSA